MHEVVDLNQFRERSGRQARPRRPRHLHAVGSGTLAFIGNRATNSGEHHLQAVATAGETETPYQNNFPWLSMQDHPGTTLIDEVVRNERLSACICLKFEQAAELVDPELRDAIERDGVYTTLDVLRTDYGLSREAFEVACQEVEDNVRDWAGVE